MSSSEEDVHQCGRCKEQFHELDLYLKHKKTNTCQKVKVKQQNSSTTGDEVANQVSNVSVQALDQKSEKPVKAPAKKRRAARELGKHNDSDQIYEWNFDGASERRSRGSKRRATAKNLKKAWAENYKDSVHQSDSLRQKDETSQNNDLAVPVKKRFVPVSSENEHPIRNGAVTRHLTRSTKSEQNVLRSEEQSSDGGNITVEDTNEQETLESSLGLLENDGSSKLVDTQHDSEASPEPKRKRRKGEKIQKIERRRARGSLYKCPACSFCSFRRGEYDRHLRKEHPLAMYCCSKCLLQVKHPSRLEAHVTTGSCQGASVNYVPNKYDSMLWPDNPAHTLQEQDQGASGLCLRVVFPYDESEVSVDYKELTCSGQHGVIQLYLKCVECDTMCQSFKDALSHFYDHWRFYPALCRYCARVFPTRRGLERHINGMMHDHLDEDQIAETKKEINDLLGCDGPVQSLSGLLRGHNDLYDCLKCEIQFEDAALMTAHLIDNHQLLTIERCFYCGICGDLHVTKDSLENHLTQSHPNSMPTPRYRCPVCDKNFKIKVKAIKHRENLHTPIQQGPYDPVRAENLDNCLLNLDHVSRPISCFVCCELFANRSDWLGHMYSHQVWIIDESVGGPMPANLFEDIGDDCPVLKIHTQVEVTVNLKLETPEDRRHHTKRLSLINQQRRKYTRPDPVSVLQNMAENIPKPGSSGLQLVDSTNKTGGQVRHSIDASHMDSLLTTPEQIATSLLASSSECVQDDEFFDKQLGRPRISQTDSLLMQSTRSDEDLQGAAGALLELRESDIGATGPSAEYPSNHPSYDSEFRDEEGAIIDPEQIDSGNPDDVSERFLCPYCLTLTDTIEEMYQHKIEDHKLRLVFSCVNDRCDATFTSLADYEAHSSIHSQKSYICNSCNWHVSRLVQLTSHKTSSHRSIHSLDTGHCCQICHMTFVSQKALITHVQQDPHHHQCTECKKVFKNASDLQDHKMIHSDEKVLLCDKCGATFVNRLALNRHRQIHTKRSHRCEQCNMTFNKGEHLRRHMISIHSDARPHACTHPGCDKKFKRKDKMQEHLKKHDDDKPYVCNKCGRRYRYREGLRYHEKKAHIEEGSYQCTECSVTFTRPSMLQQHLQEEHAVKKKYTYHCEHCDAGFYRPERLNRHMEKQHSVNVEWPLKCKICLRGFPGEKSYESHMKTRHKNEKRRSQQSMMHHHSMTSQHDMVQQAMDQTINLDQSMYEQSKLIPAQALYNPEPQDNNNKMIHAQALYVPAPDKVYGIAPQQDPCIQPEMTNKTNEAQMIYQPDPGYNNHLEGENCSTTYHQASDVDKPSGTVEWYTQPMPPLQHINVAFEDKAGNQTAGGGGQQFNQIPPLQPINQISDIATVHVENPTNLTQMNLGAAAAINISNLANGGLAVSQPNLTIHAPGLVNQPSLLINPSVDPINLTNVQTSPQLSGQVGDGNLGTVDLNNTVINITPGVEVPAFTIPTIPNQLQQQYEKQKEPASSGQNQFAPNQNEKSSVHQNKFVPDTSKKTKSKRSPRKSVKVAKKSPLPDEMTHAKLLVHLQYLHDQQRKTQNVGLEQATAKLSKPTAKANKSNLLSYTFKSKSSAPTSVSYTDKSPSKTVSSDRSFIDVPSQPIHNLSEPQETYSLQPEVNDNDRLLSPSGNLTNPPDYGTAVLQPTYNLATVHQTISNASSLQAYSISVTLPSYTVAQSSISDVVTTRSSAFPAQAVKTTSILDGFPCQNVSGNFRSEVVANGQTSFSFTPVTIAQPSFTLSSGHKVEPGQKVATLPKELTEQLIKQLFSTAPQSSTITRQPIMKQLVTPVKANEDSLTLQEASTENHNQHKLVGPTQTGTILQAALTGQTDYNSLVQPQFWSSDISREASYNESMRNKDSKVISTGLSNSKEGLVLAAGVGQQEKEGIVLTTGMSQLQDGSMLLTTGLPQGKEGMILTTGRVQPGKETMILNGGIPQGGKEGMLLTGAIQQGGKEGMLLTGAIQPGGKDGMLLTGAIQQGAKDGMLLASGIPQTGKEGMLLASGIPQTGKEGMLLASGIPQTGKEGMLFASGIPQTGKEGMLLASGIPQTAKEGMIFTSAIQHGAKEGMVLTSTIPQVGKDGMILTSAFPQVAKEGVVLTPTFAEGKEGLLLSSNLALQNAENMLLHTGKHSKDDESKNSFSSSTKGGMIFTAPGLAVGSTIQTKDGVLLTHETLASLLSSGKSVSQNEIPVLYPPAYIGGSMPQTAYVLTASSQPSDLPQVDQPTLIDTANHSSSLYHHQGIIPGPAANPATRTTGPQSINSLSQPAYLLSGGTMSITNVATTQTYL